MDDILIYSASLTDHWRVTQEILQTLCSYKLFLQPEKCKFEHQEVDYLGLVILKDHIAMDPVKVQGVTDWPQPVKVKGVCHGMTSLLPFLVFVCAPPHLCHLPTPSDLVRLPPTHIHLPSATSAPTPRCTHATMLHLHSD